MCVRSGCVCGGVCMCMCEKCMCVCEEWVCVCVRSGMGI